MAWKLDISPIKSQALSVDTDIVNMGGGRGRAQDEIDVIHRGQLRSMSGDNGVNQFESAFINLLNLVGAILCALQAPECKYRTGQVQRIEPDSQVKAESA